MKKQKWKYRYYRSPRTTQERRENGSRKDRQKEESYYNYARGSRRGCNLPSLYDDVSFTRQKSWKKERRTQYRPKWVKLYCKFCRDRIEKPEKDLNELDKNGKLCYYCSVVCQDAQKLIENPSWYRWRKSWKSIYDLLFE